MWQLIAGGGVVSVATCIILGLWGRGWKSEAKHLKDQLTQAKLDKHRVENERDRLERTLETQRSIREAEASRYEQELEEFRLVVRECKCGSAADLLNRLSPKGPDGGGQGTSGALPS